MPAVDLAFRVSGGAIPADHAYPLYAAVTEVVPHWHGPEGGDAVGIHALRGRLLGGRTLQLTPVSRLVIRLPVDRIREALALSGRELRIGDSVVGVGVPEVRALTPAARLTARIVVIKGFMEPTAFLSAARRQLAALGVKGSIEIPAVRARTSHEGKRGRADAAAMPVRRTLNIRGKEIVGFALVASGLDPEDSTRLQEAGLGGRRRFGCGLFVPKADRASGP